MKGGKINNHFKWNELHAVERYTNLIIVVIIFVN